MTLIEAADELAEALDPNHQAIRDYCRTEQEAQEQIRMLIPLAQQQIEEEAQRYDGTTPSRLIQALLQARAIVAIRKAG